MKRFWRRLIFFLFLILLLLVGTVYSLRFKPVQDFIVRKTEAWLAEKLQTRVQLGKVEVAWPHTLYVQDILLLDQASDTLLALKEAQLLGDFSSIFSQNMLVRQVSLAGCTVHINRNAEGFNFDFIEKAFPPSGSGAPSKFVIAAKNALIDLQDLSFRYHNAMDTSNMEVFAKHLFGQIEDISLSQERYALNHFELANFVLTYTQGQNRATSTDFNPKNIALQDLALDAGATAWSKEKGLSFDLRDACFRMPNVIEVGQISGKYRQAPNAHQVTDLVFASPKSYLSGNVYLTLTDSLNFDRVQAQILRGQVSMIDVREFVEIEHLPKAQEQTFDIQGNIEASLNELIFNDLRLATGAETQLTFTGEVRNYQQAELAYAQVDMESAHLLLADVLPWLKDSLPELLHASDRIDLTGTLSGNAARLAFQTNVGLTQDKDSLRLRASGICENITKTNAFRYQAHVDTLTASAAAVHRFLPPDALPKGQTLPEQMSLTGDVYGNFDSSHFQLTVIGARNAQESRLTANGMVHFAQARPQFQVALTDARLSKTELMYWLPDSIKNLLHLPEMLRFTGNAGQGENTLVGHIAIDDKALGAIQVAVNQHDGDAEIELSGQKVQLNELFSAHFFALTGLDASQKMSLEATSKLDSFGGFDMLLAVDQIAFGKSHPHRSALSTPQWSEDDDMTHAEATEQVKVHPSEQWSEDDDVFHVQGKKSENLPELAQKASAQIRKVSFASHGNFKQQTFANSRLKFEFETFTDLNAKPLEAKTTIDMLIDSANYGSQFGLSGTLSLNDSRVRTPRQASDAASDFSPDQSTFSAYHSTFPSELTAFYHLQGSPQDSVRITSDWLKLYAQGPLTDVHLPQYLEHWMSSYFGSHLFSNSTAESNASVSLDGVFYPRAVLPKQILSDGDVLPQEVLLQTQLDFNDNTGRLHVFASDFSIGQNAVTALDLDGQADGSQFTYRGYTTLPQGYLPLQIDSLLLLGYMAHDTAFVQVEMLDSLNVMHGNLQAKVMVQDRIFQLHLQPEQIIGAQKWIAKTENLITVFPDGNLTCTELHLTNGEQQLTVSGSTQDTLFVTTENLNLTELTAFLPSLELPIGGILQANLAIQMPKSGTLINGALQVDTLSWQGTSLGNLDAKFANEGGIFEIKGALNQSDGMASLHAQLMPNENLQGALSLQGFQLRAVQPFLAESVDEMTGSANGQISLGGTLSKPSPSGAVIVKNLCVIPSANHVKYCTPADTLFLSPESITLKDWEVKDQRGGNLNLDGAIALNNWSNIELKLAFDGKNIMLLDENKGTVVDQAYQGEVFADASGTITGPLDLPVINAIIKTTQASDLKYRFASVSSNTDWAEGIILFRDTLATESASKPEPKPKENAYKLNLAFEDKDLLRLKAVLNQVTGDHFEALGAGALQIEMASDGNLQMTGQYTLSEGFYQYHLHRYLSRRFEIQKGSQINWTGNPEQPELSITAQYVVKAMPPPALLNSQNAVTERQTFLLNIHIGGYLDKPEISFSIGYPTDQQYGNVTSTEITNYVESVNRDPAQVTNEMFMLLTLGRFTGSDDLNLSLGNTFSTQAFLANKLNQLTQDIKVVDIEFNSVQNGQGGTDLGFSLSRTLLDNRLILRVASTPFKENGSGMVQNFTAEYALTPNGTWKLRAFGLPEQSQFFESTQILKSGGGLLFTRNFQRFWKRK
jgi:hypothetical protein